MRLLQSLLVLAAVWPACGCLLLTGARNLLVEPLAEYTLECLEARRNETLAAAAWRSVLASHPPGSFSPHYAEGFLQGFVDYLNAGGQGAPPPVPPRKYWGVRYETPEGHSAIQDWFAGFRHGAEMAAQSRYRDWIVLPTWVPPPQEPQQRRTGPADAPQEAGEQPAMPEPLPVPPQPIPQVPE